MGSKVIQLYIHTVERAGHGLLIKTISIALVLSNTVRKLNDHNQVDSMEKDSGEVDLCPAFFIIRVNTRGET